MKLCVFFIFLSTSYTYADIYRDGYCSSTRPPNPKSGCCGFDTTRENYVFGGERTLIKQYPWLVLLEYFQFYSVKTKCGGFIISSTYVLTAGHCMDIGYPQRVRIGEYDKSSYDINQPDCILENEITECNVGAFSMPIEHIILHGKYVKSDDKSRNDIALVRLKWPIQFNDYIRPICLPTSDLTQDYTRGNDLYVAGWGTTYQQLVRTGYQNHYDPVKRHAMIPHVPDKNCSKFWTMWDKQICAGGEGAGTCDGDSGGPLMTKSYGSMYEAVGIVSFGPMYCDEMGVPSVFTKVFSYKDWIDRNIID